MDLKLTDTLPVLMKVTYKCGYSVSSTEMPSKCQTTECPDTGSQEVVGFDDKHQKTFLGLSSPFMRKFTSDAQPSQEHALVQLSTRVPDRLSARRLHLRGKSSFLKTLCACLPATVLKQHKDIVKSLSKANIDKQAEKTEGGARKLGKEHKNIHTRATPDRSWGREENIGTKHKNQTKGSGNSQDCSSSPDTLELTCRKTLAESSIFLKRSVDFITVSEYSSENNDGTILPESCFSEFTKRTGTGIIPHGQKQLKEFCSPMWDCACHITRTFTEEHQDCSVFYPSPMLRICMQTQAKYYPPALAQQHKSAPNQPWEKTLASCQIIHGSQCGMTFWYDFSIWLTFSQNKIKGQIPHDQEVGKPAKTGTCETKTALKD
ncbi:hypothetical protein Anapl_18034 [Anas platyrhynchos]|uniref:Uncharacterized protein n=1 Tax=Anas platyrhynchos TaxID=8839 RepID=R0L3W3_ANAPL|nr:hypothetical protein Anapl_18034 [Anas platyrhynchos]